MFETRHKRIKNFLIKIEKEWCDYYINNIKEFFYFSSISWSYISENRNVTMETVLENPFLPWNYSHLSLNSNINYEIVKKHPDRRWNYKMLSLNPSITFDDVLANIDKDWDWNQISIHSNLKLAWIIELKDKLNFYWNGLSQNPNLEYEWLIKFNKENWDFFSISHHDNLLLNWIKNYPKEYTIFPDKMWNYRAINQKSFEKDRKILINKVLLNLISKFGSITYYLKEYL